MRKTSGGALVTLLVLSALAAPASAQIGNVSGEPSIHLRMTSVTCFTDPHFFDGWKTQTSVTWSVDEFSKPWVNDHDLEVWSDGYRRAAVPLGAQGLAGLEMIPAHSGKRAGERWSFKVVKRTTTEKVMEVAVEAAASASCSFMPPEDGSAWVWEEDGFVLRPVVTTGPPHRLDLRVERSNE